MVASQSINTELRDSEGGTEGSSGATPIESGPWPEVWSPHNRLVWGVFWVPSWHITGRVLMFTLPLETIFAFFGPYLFWAIDDSKLRGKRRERDPR